MTCSKILLIGVVCLISFPVRADNSPADSPREESRLDENWKFYLGEPATDGADANTDDSKWQNVTLPHDWSIGQKTTPDAPTGGQGGFFPTGTGWYRLQLNAPATWSDKEVRLEFEGVYMNSEVYLNGKKLNFQPYGYTSFFVELNPALKAGVTNLLAVHVDNSKQKNTRWYSGSGIYRHVRLFVTSNFVEVAPWGVFVSVPHADEKAASLHVQTDLLNQTELVQPVKIQTVILGPDGKQLASAESDEEDIPGALKEERLAPLQPSNRDPMSELGPGKMSFEQDIPIANPPLWFPETPQLCKCITTVSIRGKVLDEVTTPFGIRALAWSADKGLTLNGKTYKLSGGCIHHDNGVLGACAFDRAEERKIQLLKAAGFNAIRTAHNPPSPEILDACDRLGMLVLDEAFDCWADGKNRMDYSVVFKDWWNRDLTNMIMRDRNHPSVVMWSIGNEIPNIYSDMGGEYGPKMAKLIHSLDSSRPVTNGVLGWPVDPSHPKPNDAERQKNADLNWNSEDIVGSNYNLNRHIAEHSKFPNRLYVSTESSPPIGKAYEVADNTFAVGDFVWSGMDYLGECGVGRWFYAGDPSEPLNPPKDPSDTKPHPVMHGSDKLYPWHGANSGDVDILGNSKPAAHKRAITWGMGEKLYMAVRQPDDDNKIIVVGWGWFPTWDSWTWPGREGKPMQVEVYSRYDSVRLYLNDKLIDEKPTTRAQNYTATITVPYAPGTLRVVGLEGGKEVGGYSLHTAGDAVGLKLTADQTTLQADGQGLSFIDVETVDKAGKLNPNGDQLVTFTLTGPGTIAGLGNANLKNTEPYQGTQVHVYHGRALIVLRSTKQAGTLGLKAESQGLAAAGLEVKVE